jgi:hypothetical protein
MLSLLHCICAILEINYLGSFTDLVSVTPDEGSGYCFLEDTTDCALIIYFNIQIF